MISTKKKKLRFSLNFLKEEKSIALVSDAGTPLISDPGYFLVTRAIAINVPIVPIPGPSSVVAALSVAGLPTDAFTFIGFLPKKSSARTRLLESLREETKTIILFETPYRIKTTLLAIQEMLGDRRIAISRELTKAHEEIIRGTVQEILLSNSSRVLKGEMTLVIQGKEKRRRQDLQPGFNHRPSE